MGYYKTKLYTILTNNLILFEIKKKTLLKNEITFSVARWSGNSLSVFVYFFNSSINVKTDDQLNISVYLIKRENNVNSMEAL